MDARIACPWALRSALETCYHDTEWGTPLHDDRGLFEFLVLEGAQAGLSWLTILRKREAYRSVFANFDPVAVARYGGSEIGQLLANPGIVRNRSKVEAAIANAQAFLKVQEEFGSFDAYLWRFVDERTRHNRWRTASELPVSTPVSAVLSKDLRTRGFKFVGPTICYSFMQAVGMVNDHLVGCFRWAELGGGTSP